MTGAPRAHAGARRGRLGWRPAQTALAALWLIACPAQAPAPPDAAAAPPAPPAFAGGFVERVTPAGLPLYAGDGVYVVPDSSYGLFADLDGDGLPEVILATPTLAPGEQVRAFAEVAGALVPRDDLAWPPGVVRAVADLDGDGLAEAVFVGDSLLTVSWARGDGTWSEPEATGAVASGLSEGGCTLMDLDSDGWLDLVLGTTDAMVPVFAAAGRRFVARPQALQGLPPAAGFAVMAAEVHPGEPVVLSLGGPPPSGGPGYGIWTTTARDDEGYPLLEPQPELPDDAALVTVGGYPAGSPLSTFAPMGGDVGDIDGDGQTDLLVALDPVHLVMAGRPGWPLLDRTEQSGIREVLSTLDQPMLPWGMILVDLDRDGRLDLVTSHGDDPGTYYGGGRPAIGPQWATAHWNAGQFRFTDVTAAVGLGRLGNWRSLAIGDLGGDGDADFIVGGLGEDPRVWANALEPSGRGLALRLRGTSSNALGIGARVTLVAQGLAQTHQMHLPSVVLGGGEPVVFLALGALDAAPLVRIAWPSGHVQELSGLAAGRLHVVAEPETVTLDPPSRAAPADGVSSIRVRYAPRAPDGGPRAVASASLSITHGGGQVTSPMRATGAAFEAVVTSPSAPGSAVLELRVDGAPLPLRPRLFWR